MTRMLAWLLAFAVTAPALAFTVTLTPSAQTVSAGDTAALTVTIDPVQAAAVNVFLHSDAPECAMVTLKPAQPPLPAFVTIPAGSTTAAFDVLATSPACGDVPIRVTASVGAISQTAGALLHILPAGAGSADLSTSVRFTSLTQESHHGSTGHVFHFEATLRNGGPDAATNARLLVSLPCMALLFDTVSSSCPRVDESGVPMADLCEFDAIPAGETRVATVVVSNRDCAFTVRGTAAEVDPEPANDSATAAIPPLVDLSVSIAVPPTARIGEKVTHVITVRNLSPRDAATGVTALSILPLSTEVLSVTPARGDCSVETFIARSITCELGTLEPLSAVTIAVVTMSTEGGGAGVFVEGDEPDPDTTNNAASASFALVAAIPLSPAALIALAIALGIVGARLTAS